MDTAARIAVTAAMLVMTCAIGSLTASPNLLSNWAAGHGARISEAIVVRGATPSSPRGLFAVQSILAGDELIMLPERLQCGVPTLAAGEDVGMQQMCGELDVGFQTVRCAVALCGEVRLGDASLFSGYINDLPTPSNAWAPDPAGCGWAYDASAASDQEPELLPLPSTAASAATMRKGLRLLHSKHAPAGLPLHELCWAAAIASSRAFRVRPRQSTDEQAARLGWRSTDSTRLLPLIDMANHAAGDGANAALGDDSAQPWKHSVRLVATRTIAPGEEITLDYGGGGQPLSNEQLLLDYGFFVDSGATAGGQRGGADERPQQEESAATKTANLVDESATEDAGFSAVAMRFCRLNAPPEC